MPIKVLPTDTNPQSQTPVRPTHTTPSFTLRLPFIYSEPSLTPVHHIQSLQTKKGQTWHLQFSRLLPSEMRRLGSTAHSATTTANSVNSAFASNGATSRVRYDEDLTLYLAQKIRVPFSIGSRTLLCMRGCKRGTLRGTVILERAGRYSSTLNFLHLTPVCRSVSAAENQKLQYNINRRGYKASDDWNEKLLFSVKPISKLQQANNLAKCHRLQWLNGHGHVVAIEDSNSLHLVQYADDQTKELLVACWLSKKLIHSDATDSST